MLQTSGGARLAQKPLREIAIEADLRRQHFHRLAAMEASVKNAIHFGHAAAPQQTFDAIGTDLRSFFDHAAPPLLFQTGTSARPAPPNAAAPKEASRNK